MSVDHDRVAEPGKERPRATVEASGGDADVQYRSAIEAGSALVAALRHLIGAFRKLAAAEGRLMLESIPLAFIAAVALIAFSVSLWVCVVALIGWALMVGTHSLGLALGLLVVMHAVLVFCIWGMIKYSLHQATFPRARAELRLVGRTLRYDLDRLTGAAQDPVRPTRPASTSKQKGAR